MCTFQGVKEQVTKKNAVLNEAAENGLWLKDNCEQNTPVKLLVDERLNTVEKDFDTLKEKLAEKTAQLELLLYKKQSYELSMEQFMSWCVSVDKMFRKQERVSLRYYEILRQQRELQVS